MKFLHRRDFLWLIPFSIIPGAVLSFLQPGNWLIGWLGFSFLFLLSFSLLTMAMRWGERASRFAPAGDATTGQSFDKLRMHTVPPLPRNTLGLRSAKILKWMVALAFVLRFAGGVTTYLVLPINGYDDEDDRAGFIFTDAHRRDEQAWELAKSNLPIYDAFNKNYAYDQYGGLLAFSAFVYRYFSPDAHRPLMLVLLSAFMAALGLPFLWKAASQQWGEKIALVAGWIYALYPESVLLGGAAMREPYLMAFSAFSLWGFVSYGVKELAPSNSKLFDSRIRSLLWLGLGIVGMLLVSPAVALFTLSIFAGWMYFTRERARVPAWAIVAIVLVFIVGLFALSSALDRAGELGGFTPIGVINNFLREVVKRDLSQLERDSGRVALIFEQWPESLHLPFVVTYGILQPIIIPAFIEPTTLIWRVIAILRGLGWWTLLPVLVFSLVAAAGSSADKNRKLWIWIAASSWTWILFAALRGGGDQWDNPRYRAILLLWQALAAAYAWATWRETKNPWFTRILLMEGVLLAFFGEWYADRYFQIGGKMSFGPMVALISAIWAGIAVYGWVKDRRASKLSS
ncbi:MAG: hypothetical protein AB1649_01065 [Chloroflexota bacterium]